MNASRCCMVAPCALGLPAANDGFAAAKFSCGQANWRELDLTCQNILCSMFADYLLIAPLKRETEQALFGPFTGGACVISAARKFQALPSPAIEALQRAATPFRG